LIRLQQALVELSSTSARASSSRGRVFAACLLAMKSLHDESKNLLSQRWKRIAGALSLVALAAAGPAAGEQPEPSLFAVSGERLYVRHCAVCHGISGRGDGPFGGILRTAPADLTTIAARNGGKFPDAEIARFVDGQFVPPAHGTRQMPIWGRWLGASIVQGAEPDEAARGEILAILEYLKTLQRPLPQAK
jgi:mono/diheme cytochrome c family protein